MPKNPPSTSNNPDVPSYGGQERKFVNQKIQELRKQLLDLTGKNPLLNYRHPKGSSIRVVDELPNLVAEALQAGKSFTFEAVPRPTEKELIEGGFIKLRPGTKEVVSQTTPTAEAWAKHLGIQTSFELPQGNPNGAHHQDSKLQTLRFPDDLEAKLRSINSRARSAITEMGCNILFLNVGFLEWYESESSDRKRLAPLYTLAVEIKRDKLNAQEGTYRYRISPLDEDVLDNITLREKLESDFGIALPPIGSSEDPEDFFEKVKADILRHQPRWQVHRYITLATLNFQKQAMYEDLDPKRWGKENSILDHPVIRAFFTSSDAGENHEGSDAREYAIDAIDDSIDRYPIIFDADSSQHSAIIDALDGKNLVIEGPPGTGKSQTITNLIAAAIAAGKTVLFVAEKMAALEVVKNRLEFAGLGDFCLELHGHKGQKSQVMGSLSKRLSSRFPRPKSIDTDKQLLLQHRNRLNDHSVDVNCVWKKTEKTAHQIFAGAVRYRQGLPDGYILPQIDSISGDSLTPINEQQLIDKTRRLSLLHAAVSKQTPGEDISTHYWHGIRNVGLLKDGHFELLLSLEGWTDKLDSLVNSFVDCAAPCGVNTEADRSSLELTSICTISEELPELAEFVRLELLAPLCKNLAQAEETSRGYDSIHNGWGFLALVLESSALSDDSAPNRIISQAKALRATGLSPSATLEDLSWRHKNLSALTDRLATVFTAFDRILERVPSNLRPCFQPSREGLREYLRLSNLIRELPPELWRHREQVFDNPELDSLLTDLREQFGILLKLRAKLEATFLLDDLPSAHNLQRDYQRVCDGGFLKWFSSEWRSARKRLISLSIGDKETKGNVLGQAPTLIEYVKGLEDAKKINRDTPALGEHYRGIDTPIDRLSQIRKWYRSVRDEYGVGFGSRTPLGEALLSLNRELAEGISEYNNGSLFEDAHQLGFEMDEIAQEIPDHDFHRTEKSVLLGPEGSLTNVADIVGNYLKEVAPLFRDTSCSITTTCSKAEELELHQTLASEWTSSAGHGHLTESGFSLSVDFKKESPSERMALHHTLAVASIAAKSPEILRAITESPQTNTYKALKSIHKKLRPALTAEEESRQSFSAIGDVDLVAWKAQSGNGIQGLAARNRSALDKDDWISDWLHYQRIKQELIPEGLEDFIRHLEEDGLSEKDVGNVSLAIIHEQLAQEILAEDKSLHDFYGPDQDGIRDQFKVYDEQVILLKRREIASHVSKKSIPIGKSGGRVGDLTQRKLIEWEVKKKTRHIALRDLMNRAGEAVIGLKSCFLMSPMSVATHLEPGRHQFDIVIMDEASQIRPADALGAIARGKSVVIVGDPKQLPPTSFFDRAVNDEEDIEDQVTLQDSESILDAVSGIFPTRRLRWHYRSRHESLIEFSAENFYSKDLVLFPSPFEDNPEFGVKFHRTEDGFFQEGLNKPEGRAIVDFLITQLEDSPHESVGVVAMNAAQRDFLEQSLEDRMKSDTKIQHLVDSRTSGEEPLFFKNLESVQGDERDVIIISMTYGPLSPGSKVPQRFGPINRDGGWRRLNVLFTRSKKRMHIFSSMTASDILVDHNTKDGKKALHGFLAYCEKRPDAGAEITGKDPDSDFEVSVITALQKHGYICEPQLGVAGYFLDIAVRDPNDLGRFLVGIECDGATYHSAKSARDRDRLRQQVLEGLGWNIQRIWSTDWFHNPDAQIQRILNVLIELRSS